ncbi:hypothetical protein [Pseudoalteromonas phage PH357]|nr:hypothetical protein [Pseudoalteromonas phage PH357]
MKLQFKTEEILKKVDALILKDIAAKKKLNLDKQEAYEKESSEYDSKLKDYEDFRNKGKLTLSKYSDEELLDIFFIKTVDSVEGGWFSKGEDCVSYTVKAFHQVLDEVPFVISPHVSLYLEFGIPVRRILHPDDYISKGKVVHAEDKATIWCGGVPPQKPIAPLFQEETPSKELLSLKEKILLAKSYGVEDIILEVLKKDYTYCKDTSLSELMAKIHEEMYNRGGF